MKFDITLSHRVHGLDDLVSYVEVLARQLNRAVGADHLHVYNISIWTRSTEQVSVSFWSGKQDYFGGFTCTNICKSGPEDKRNGWLMTTDDGQILDDTEGYLTDMYFAVCSAMKLACADIPPLEN